MSSKRYEMKCEYCGDPYVAKKKGSRFCSAEHKAQWWRNHNEGLKIKKEPEHKIQPLPHSTIQRIEPDSIKEHSSGTVQKLSVEIGKDLTECKRPDGSHLYTDQDLWILIAKINQVVFNENTGNLLSVLHTDRITNELIRDFERRFDCRFDDVKKANPSIRPGSTDADNESLVIQYASLEYSRKH